jgi:ERCC4-related helicase
MFHRGVSNHMHPKLSKLAEILQSFFAQQQGKAMVFTQLRISAKEIKEYLSTVEGVRS